MFFGFLEINYGNKTNVRKKIDFENQFILLIILYTFLDFQSYKKYAIFEISICCF